MRPGRVAALAAAALLGACARPMVSPPDDTIYHRLGGLEISALVERDLSDVLGAVDLMNTTADTVRLEYAGSCALAILVFGGPDLDGEPRWDSSEWWAGQGECPTGIMRLDIPPETLARVIAPMVGATRILGDSLPSGSYNTALRLRVVQPHDTTIVLPAGPIELDRPSSAPGFARWAPLARRAVGGHDSPPSLIPPPSNGHP